MIAVSVLILMMAVATSVQSTTLECIGHDDPHFITFSGLDFNCQAKNILLSKSSGKFSIDAETDQINPNKPGNYIVKVNIAVRSCKISIQEDGDVYYGNTLITTFPYTPSKKCGNIEITIKEVSIGNYEVEAKKNGNIVLEVTTNLKNKHHVVNIKLSGDYENADGNLKGVCGNSNDGDTTEMEKYCK